MGMTLIKRQKRGLRRILSNLRVTKEKERWRQISRHEGAWDFDSLFVVTLCMELAHSYSRCFTLSFSACLLFPVRDMEASCDCVTSI